ncbi:hypothetical protein ACQF36_29245 [Streptomyces sp. Marseille-Q5077]|uniref:hypothetical protein n=1 Tax=Streptomyces sp. Marseille-Q5077 TaxID=3418995 RepID=UPI003CFF7564
MTLASAESPDVTPASRQMLDLRSPAHSGLSGHWALEHLKITDAVYRLESATDDDYGSVPRPDPSLADELAEFTG